MLPDRLFYPLAAIIIAAMVAFALSLGGHERPSDQQIIENGFTVEGEALTKLTASPGTNFEYIAATSSSPAYVRLWSEIARSDAPPSAGVFAALNSDYERAFAGEMLRMTVTARQSRRQPLEEFDVGYFTAGAGDSGWKSMPLTDQWQDYSFTFRPNLPQADPDIDYFGIWPGITGEPLSMDVAKMQIEVISPQ